MRLRHHIQTAVFLICDSPLFYTGIKCTCATLPWHQYQEKNSPWHLMAIAALIFRTEASYKNSWQFSFCLWKWQSFIQSVSCSFKTSLPQSATSLSTSLLPHQLYIRCSIARTVVQLLYYCRLRLPCCLWRAEKFLVMLRCRVWQVDFEFKAFGLGFWFKPSNFWWNRQIKQSKRTAEVSAGFELLLFSSIKDKEEIHEWLLLSEMFCEWTNFSLYFHSDLFFH